MRVARSLLHLLLPAWPLEQLPVLSRSRKILLATLLVSVPLFAAASVNVTASHLDILESPSATAPVLGQLKAGDKVVVESCAEDFCEILGDVDSGYETAFVSK